MLNIGGMPFAESGNAWPHQDRLNIPHEYLIRRIIYGCVYFGHYRVVCGVPYFLLACPAFDAIGHKF